jgi:hypothetical protein
MFELKLENESGNIVDINDDENYVVLSVSGLSPPSASLFTSKSPNRKGVKYNGSTLDERNIVIEIKIKGDVEANRNALYGWIDTEQYCKVRYRNGVKNVYCEGYVQECDIDLFTDNEVVSVAIVCPDPYWKDLAEISADISLLLKQFTLPFAISAAGVPFSTMRTNNATTIFNAGAETGVKITVKCKSDIVNLTIFDARDTTKRFVLKTTLKSGSIAEIDTEASPKTVKVTNSDGTVSNLMRYIGGNPTWFTLKKGINQFAYTADAGLNDAEITVGFSYKFAGV